MIDSPPSSPGSENNADAMVAFLASLQKLTAAGLAILILHHPSKKTHGEGQAARGSGALSGAVDILIEMHWGARPSKGERRRRLKAWSRHPQTPPRLIIELNETATDYTTAPEPAKKKPRDDDMPPPLREVLSEAGYKLTRHEILDAWPRHSRRPSSNLLWRWFNRAHQSNLIKRDGTGHHTDPYRYWLPQRQEEWNRNPFISLAIRNFEDWKRARSQTKAGAPEISVTEEE